MGKRTKKLLITLGCVSLFAAGNFFRGYQDHKIIQGIVAQANEQIFLFRYDSLHTRLQMCIIAANGKIFQYLRTNDPQDAAIAGLTIDKCDEWLDTLGTNAPDEKTSTMLGQARLFFDGFRKSASAIISRQVELEELYGTGLNLFSDAEKLIKIKKLEEEQNKDIPEFNKFTSRIFLSILQGSPSQPEAEK